MRGKFSVSWNEPLGKQGLYSRPIYEARGPKSFHRKLFNLSQIKTPPFISFTTFQRCCFTVYIKAFTPIHRIAHGISR